MTFYTSIIILTELMMIAMALHVLFYSGFQKNQKTWYLFTFIAIMLCAAAEFAAHCGKYDPAYKIPLTIVTVLQFSLAPMLGIFFSGALSLRKTAKYASLFFLLNLIFEIVAAPFGWAFYFDAKGYHRGELFIVYEAFYLVSLVYLIVCMIIVGKRFRHRDVQTIAMVLVILVAGILPMTLFQLNVTYIAIAISACLCYIYYNDLIQQNIQSDFAANQKKISDMQEHIIFGLANLIENRDIETGEHITRTGAYVKLLAETARNDGVYVNELTDHFISLLCTLAPMHDIGKIIVSDNILKKPGKLTPEEYEQMKKHAEYGGSIVRSVLSGVTNEESLTFASDIATYHHEWWNGTGYPKKLKGTDIPLSARIMAIADVFDALISKRCYKDAIPAEKAIKIIEEESGTHFDPLLVSVFLRHKEEFLAVENKNKRE